MKTMTASQFRKVREDVLEMTRREFAKKFGFTPRHVRDLEQGIKRITQKNTMLMTLARVAKENDLVDFERL